MTTSTTHLLRRRLLALAPALLATGRPALALETGTPAPPLELPGRDGPASLAALRGRVVLLDFWASWCAPCRLSFPWMDGQLARHAGAGLSVLAVNLDRQRAAAEQFLRAVPTQATLVFDPAGESPRRFGVRAMPTTFVIGRDGRIRLQHDGFRDEDRAPLEAALREALAA